MSRKCALVTGSGRGIGRATALHLARDGYDLAVVSRNSAELADVRREVEATGVSCHTFATDVAVPANAEQLVSGVIARFGRVDVLVNNAGIAPLAKIDELSTADFDALTALNISAVFHLSRLVWPHMKSGGGVIVNISSQASIDPFPGFAAYGASKAWVNLFTRAMADEGKPLGIRAFAVAPGAVETKLLRSRFKEIPAAACLSPEEVAGVVAACCGDAMRPCSGQTIFVRR